MKFQYTEICPNLITDVMLILDSDPTIGIPIYMSLEQNAEFVKELVNQESYIRRLEEAFVTEYQSEAYGSESMARYALNLIRNGVE